MVLALLLSRDAIFTINKRITALIEKAVAKGHVQCPPVTVNIVVTLIITILRRVYTRNVADQGALTIRRDVTVIGLAANLKGIKLQKHSVQELCSNYTYH